MFDYKLDISKNSFMRVFSDDTMARSFPFTLHEEGYFEAGSEYFTVRDFKPMYLLMYTVSGGGVVQVGGKLRHLDAGHAIFINCRVPHEYRTVSTDQPWCFHYIHIDSASLAGYAPVLLNDITVVKIGETLRMEHYFNEIHSISRDEDSVKKYARLTHIIAAILSIMVGSAEETETGDIATDNVITNVCSYIEEHLNETISIEQLSQMVHLSKFYFIRLFKKHMGVSPYHYVQIARINQAKKLLVTTSYRINEIAEMTGFPSAARFTRLFSESVGMTPSHYRQTRFYS